MVELITLQESLAFSAWALLFSLIIMRVRPEMRRSVLVTLLILTLALGGLSLLGRYQVIPARLAIAALPREICLLIIALCNIRIYISFLINVVLARRAVPRILGEVTIAVTLVVYTLFRMDALGVNLTTITVSWGALAAAVGFAMQATLGNLLGGISLQLDNTCRIGDWIETEGVTGEVVSIRWRYTALATVNNVTIIIPNAKLMNNPVTLLGRRGDLRIPWRRPIEFQVGYEFTPGQVMAVVNAALERVDIALVAADPKAICLCAGFDTNAIKFLVYYWLTDIKYYMVTDSQVRVHVYAALGRAGMEFPIARSDLYLHSARSLQASRAMLEQEQRIALLGSLELFTSLTDDEKRALATQLVPTPFAKGDVATKQGEPSDSLYILARGNVAIFRNAEDGNFATRQRMATMGAPNYFGEMGLLAGAPRGATVEADTEVQCYRLDKGGFEAILRARPEIANGMAQTVAARLAANDATLATLSAEARAKATGTRASDVLRRVREFFGL
ncbi:MAG: mechanosensitive ion channel family protein [Casimicrobiaceae bacterium]